MVINPLLGLISVFSSLFLLFLCVLCYCYITTEEEMSIPNLVTFITVLIILASVSIITGLLAIP